MFLRVPRFILHPYSLPSFIIPSPLLQILQLVDVQFQKANKDREIQAWLTAKPLRKLSLPFYFLRLVYDLINFKHFTSL